MRRLPSLLAGLLVALLGGGLLPLAGPAPAVRAAATFGVNTTTDRSDERPGDGRCSTGVKILVDDLFVDLECTLRAAIQEADRTTAADTIAFAIQSRDPNCHPTTRVCTIRPTSSLPAIGETVTIDGYTQPGASPNTAAVGTNAVLTIELDGTNVGDFPVGLAIFASDTLVRGLVVNRFAESGIRVIDDLAPTGVRVLGCFLGTDAAGTEARPNGAGVVTAGAGTVVGGADRAARNLISGNADAGVGLIFSPAGSRVQGNLIGTDKTGAAPLPNGVGVRIRASNTVVGGNLPAEANVVAFNHAQGVKVEGTFDRPATGNRILRNRIFANAGLGIDLAGGTEDFTGATANDPKDPDAGPNDLQNKPVLTAAATAGGTTSVRGQLNSTPGRSFVLRFFANPAGHNEGKTFVGQKSVVTNTNGTAAFTFAPAQAVKAGQALTATATDAGGNTSEFSPLRTVVAG